MDRLIPRTAPGLPPAPPGHQPLISVTPDTLPAGELVRPVTIPVTPDLDHYLLVMDLDQVACDPDRLEAIYLALRGPVRTQVLLMLGTPDPAVDPVGYWVARWWRQGVTIDLDLIRYAERLGRAYPWWHGRTAGPTLSPPRA